MEFRTAEYIDDNERVPARDSWAPAHPVIRTVLYLLVVMLISLLMTWLFVSDIKWGFSDHFKKIFYVILFFLIGTAHIFSFSKWLLPIENQDSKAGLLYSLLLTLIIGSSTFFLLVFTEFDKPQLAVTAACSFLLPAAISLSWNYFDSITGKTYPTWYLPTTTMPQKIATILLNSLQVRIRVKINYFDIDETTFIVTIPGRGQLGNMFHQFLLEKEETGTKFQLSDQQQQPYAWRFLLQKPFGAQVLDPEITILDNRIKQNDTILAERFKVT